MWNNYYNFKCDNSMAMFKEASYLLEICTEILADKMKKHFKKSQVHYILIF